MAQFLPLTHAVNISRAVFLGTYSSDLIVNFLFLLAVEAAAFYAGIRFMKRRLIK
jgi:ABC-type multidrug transport system permease subunit